MILGNGIAIFGIWLFASACAVSRTVSGVGFALATVVALLATLVVVMQ